MVGAVVRILRRIGRLIGVALPRGGRNDRRTTEWTAKDYHETFHQLFDATASSDPIYERKRRRASRAA